MRQKWEYKRIVRTRKREPLAFGATYPGKAWEIEIDENALGQDGWELVTVHYTKHEPSETFTPIEETWFFKRPI